MKYEKGQFVTVPNVKYLDGQKGITTAVYFWICSYADQDGICFPSRKLVAEKIGVSLQTLDREINKLCELGLLKKEHRFVGNEKTSNEYQILIKEGGGSPKSDMTLAPKERLPSPQKKHIELNPINQTQLTKQRFMEWWGSYPMRRVDKDKCEKKFEKFSEEIQLQIIADTKKRVLEDEKWKKGFVPMTSTYLNNKKWEDDYEKVEVPASTGVKVYE